MLLFLLFPLTLFQQTLKELGIPADMTLSFNAGNDSRKKRSLKRKENYLHLR